MKNYIMGIHGWVLGFEKDESFQFRYPFKDCGFKACFETFLTSVFFRSCLLNLFSEILEGTFIVWNFETFSNFLFLTLQFFQDLSFYYHIPFKEVLRIGITAWMHLHVEGTDSRMNPFKGGADGMTRDKHENMESFQGPVTRSRARKTEEQTQRKRARLKKIKANDGNFAKGMVGFIEEAMKNKNERFEDQAEPFKLLTIYTISKDYSPSKLLTIYDISRIIQGSKLEVKKTKYGEVQDLPPIVGPAPTVCGLPLPPTVGFYMGNPWSSTTYCARVIMSTDGHMQTQSHQEGTSEPSMRNLNETLRNSFVRRTKDAQKESQG
ncbi:hypothetical protein M9H77_11739 [Catharanthus roseus]|uniref:Uncharacterized protein n=1 Tax=Catharanthus roseus TaxID=4058 RepID=A0ACC0BFD5_CATRO|nr:hypothetical protein M9H77_11739 [Catharanthus roseus]